MNPALDQLLRNPGVWRAADARSGHAATRSVATGNAELDDWLPGGGWPAGALTELICEHHGIGEFGLLMPLVARLTCGGERVALVAPPLLPYAPALAAAEVDLSHLLVIRPRLAVEGLWAAEQLLRSAVFAAVVTWLHGEPDTRTLRRLQLAAEQGDACLFAFRDAAGLAAMAVHGEVAATPRTRCGAGDRPGASPATLRLQIAPCGSRARAAARGVRMPRLVLNVLKCRGRAPGMPLAL